MGCEVASGSDISATPCSFSFFFLLRQDLRKEDLGPEGLGRAISEFRFL